MKMLKGLSIYLILVAVILTLSQAAVLRPMETSTSNKHIVTTETDSDATTSSPVEFSTMTIKSKVARVALSREEDASVYTGLVTSTPATAATEQADLGVHIVKPITPEKSANLLLLSTPPKRFTEVELQLEEEPETAGGATTAASATDMDSSTGKETSTESSAKIDENITKLFAINATSLPDSAVPSTAIAVAADNSTVAIAEQPQEVPTDNVGIGLTLVQPEVEYVLFDTAQSSDVIDESQELQLGSFTHIGSDEHLQPAVHSVEIVPTSFDDPLIVNYVHSFA